MPFSRKELIEQLVYDKYPVAEATWAVDNLTVNWSDQAARKAISYLKLMPFSQLELVDQLVYDGFTSEQATYGVQQAGL